MQGGWQPPGGGGGGYGGPPQGFGGAPPGYDPSQGQQQQQQQQGQGYGQPPSQQGYGQPQPPQQQQGYGQPPAPAGYGQPPPGPGGFGAPAPMGYPGGGFGTYEFNELENGIIGKTAGRAHTWGIISIVVDALNTLVGFLFIVSPSLLVNLVTGIVSIVVGVTFLGAGNSLQNVVQTQGNDMEHMMQAMQKMSSAFMVQIITTIVGFILGAIVMVIAIFVLAAVAATS